MTKEERAARADLRRKVKGLMKANNKLMIEKLESLMRSGAGIVGDHMAGEGQYSVPKDFLCAFAKEMERQWGRPCAWGGKPDRKWARRINNYYVMM